MHRWDRISCDNVRIAGGLSRRPAVAASASWGSEGPLCRAPCSVDVDALVSGCEIKPRAAIRGQSVLVECSNAHARFLVA